MKNTIFFLLILSILVNNIFAQNMRAEDEGDFNYLNKILNASNTIQIDDIDSTKDAEKLRFYCYYYYLNDTSNLKSLLLLSQLSEYLADYKIAVTGYEILLKKLNNTEDKSFQSKIKAHQITCNFLTQSQQNKTSQPIQASENNNGIYGIGIRFRILDNHVYIYKLFEGLPADVAGLQPLDEIVKVDNKSLPKNDLTETTFNQQLRSQTNKPVLLTIRRLGSNDLIEINVERTLISATTAETKTENQQQSVINDKQQQKQNFLKKMVTSLQKDSSIIKTIETAKKINYALTILNKWANEPLGKNLFLQIDEQLGMVSSLVNIIRGNNPNFSFDANGKISFADPELKELVFSDYSKDAQNKFDSVASVQPYVETKIDDNITLVEKNNSLEDFPGEFDYDKLISTNCPKTDVDLPHVGEVKKTAGGYIKVEPIKISIQENAITLSSSSDASYSGFSHTETRILKGIITNKKATLKGTSIMKNNLGGVVEGTIEQTIDFSDSNFIKVWSTGRGKQILTCEMIYTIKKIK